MELVGIKEEVDDSIDDNISGKDYERNKLSVIDGENDSQLQFNKTISNMQKSEENPN